MKQAIAIAIIVAACATIAGPVRAADSAAQLNAQELARIQSGGAPPSAPMAAQPMAPPRAAASRCAPGYRWAAAGYIKKAKYRPAGCVRIR